MNSNRKHRNENNHDHKKDLKASEHEPSRHRSSSKYKMNNQLLAQTQGNNNNNNINKNKSDMTHQIARERWKILKRAILDKKSTVNSASVRRFDSFGFIKCVKVAYNKNTNTDSIPDSRAHEKNKHNSKHNHQKMYHTQSIQLNDSDSDDDDICVASRPPNKNKNNRVSESDAAYEWFNISIPNVNVETELDSVKVRFYKSPIGLKDMMGFNNTGNVCLWPSEEIMTYFCIKNSAIFDDKSVCELGGGMTCLGGLMISRFSQPNEVFLTDGNEASFENLEVICSDNEFRCSVECCLLQWSKKQNYGDLENRFDYIICADCLFFDDYREDLCATIWKLLKMDGMCLIFAPNRKNTFHKFVDMAKLHFECMIVHDYDIEVWERHLYEKENNLEYDEDLHYPLLLKLKKRTRATNDFCKMVL